MRSAHHHQDDDTPTLLLATYSVRSTRLNYTNALKIVITGTHLTLTLNSMP